MYRISVFRYSFIYVIEFKYFFPLNGADLMLMLSSIIEVTSTS